MKRVVLYILFLLINLNSSAQVVYPIRSYTILQPPLPYNLNGFVSEAGKINLNIIVDDVDLDQYAVKFRLHIEGNGIKLTTRPDFFQQPYYLEGAGTHTLTGFDLEDILNPDNLIFEGYSRNQYKQTGRLPEGVYRIWVDVYDYYRNVKVSMSSPGIAMIFLAKAPRLSFPLNQTEIDSDVMQNIRFSWFSILPADPLADVRYRFKLFEIRPDGRDPYEITRVTQPIYQEETNQSSFVYDLSMPPLISGMSYAWKVEAYDLENRVLFQNDGHSDVLSFRYGKSCEIPELSIKEVKSKFVSLSWITDVAATEYTLAYKRTKDETWQEEKTDLLKYTLNDLDDNSGYQIKIKARCGDSETGFSRIQELKTTREVNYACGNKSDNFDLSNTEPLASLGRFDEFKAADFIVEVEEVSGGNGNFTGKGYALVPYLGFLKFRVEFENIFVNSDSRMTSGEIKFVYDVATGMIIGENAGGEEEDDTVNVNDELEEISNKVIVSDTDITSVIVSGGNVVITHTDGTSETVAIGDSKVISVTGGDNDSGNAYVVDAGSGQVFTTPKKVAGGGKGSSAVGTGSQTGEYGCSVSFSKASMQRYGFDQIGDGVNKPDSYFLKSKTGELIDWKSLESGSTDFVNINVNGTCSADSLRYLRESGLLTPSAPNKKGRQLLLTGLSEGEEDILSVAVAKTKMGSDSSSREILTLAGALGLVSYDRISKDVVLVPVNGAQCPDNIGLLGKELNDIYGPAVVNWNVSIEKNLEVEAIKGKVFEHSGAGTLSKYTSDMREVINEFKDERDHDRQTVYLFFINENTATKTGFMPLASEYGFIFNFRTETHVIAHELGHSKNFNLRHTFSEKAQHFFPERSTQNLMDYAGGQELWKYQWDLIHNPENIIFDWEQDELITKNDEEEGDNSSSEESTNNLIVGTDAKKDDVIQFGPILISLKSDPVNSNDNGVCSYSVDQVNFVLKLKDDAVGDYEVQIEGAQLSYSVDCNDGKLKGANISWENNSGIELKNIGILDADIYKLELAINEEGNLSGSTKLKAKMDSDKVVSPMLVVKKGVSGNFEFLFSDNSEGVEGSFNFNGINNINVDLLKSAKVFASVKHGSLNNKGILNSDVTLEEAISYTENGFNISLQQLNGKIEYALLNNEFDFKQLKGKVKINQIPGVDSSLDIDFSMVDASISGQVSNVSPIVIYGMSLEAKSLNVVFNKQFELVQLEGNEITASYNNSKAGKALSGDIIINNILLKDNQLQHLSGSGTVAYDPFAKIALSGAEFDSQTKSIEFQASVDIAVSGNNSANTTINKVSIFEDGTYEIGEVSVDLLAHFGPIEVEFSKKLNTSNRKKNMDAKISVNVKEGDIDKNISFNTSVEYINTNEDGFTYVKIDAKDLDIDFAPIYSIDTKVNSVGFEYIKNTDGSEIHGVNVELLASLSEDKFIYKDMIKLKKGVSGTILYSYNSKDQPQGEFDLSNLKNLQLHLIKEDKSMAVFSGSINKSGLMNGKFIVKEPQSYSSSGFKTTLTQFDVNSSFHLKNREFKFISGSGKASISEIKGLNGVLEIELAYLGNNFSAGVSANEQNLSFCKAKVSDLDFSFEMNEDLNLEKISGGFSIQPDGVSSKLQLSSLLIEKGEVISADVKGNVDYKKFKFDLLSGSYSNRSLNIDAKVLLGDAYASVDEFKISEKGEISIGKVAGAIKKSLMDIKFDAAFAENKFKGSFDAKISKKLAVNGTVDMGSSTCSTCTGGAYNFGYYALTVGTAIPVFPGISISKLGGQFGYNYMIDFDKKPWQGNPEKDSYLVGLSFGLQDNAGLVELAVDPAIFQWGKENATLSLTGTIKAPKINPIFEGKANVNLEMPSYDIHGSLEADIKIPAKSGYIVKANTEMAFEMNDKIKSFSSTNMTASILNVIKYDGSFSNTRKYNSEGILTGSNGYLNGELAYNFEYSDEMSKYGADLSYNFKFAFEAYLQTGFNDAGLLASKIGGSILAEGYLKATALGCTFNPYINLKGDANLKYLNPLWEINSSYKFTIGLGMLGEKSFDGSYKNLFE